MNLKADTRRYMQKGKEHTPFPFLLNRLIYSIVNKEFILFYHYTNENNPDDSSRQDYFCNSGSTCYGMVDRNHTNSNPFYRFSEMWFCAVVDLPEKL